MVNESCDKLVEVRVLSGRRQPESTTKSQVKQVSALDTAQTKILCKLPTFRLTVFGTLLKPIDIHPYNLR